MQALRIILGAIFILAALFAGGCSLFFTTVFLQEGGGGPYTFWPINIAGYAAAALLGLSGWLLLRIGRNGRPPG